MFVLTVLPFIDILGHIIAIGALDILVRIADTIVVFVQGVAVTTRFGLAMEKEHYIWSRCTYSLNTLSKLLILNQFTLGILLLFLVALDGCIHGAWVVGGQSVFCDKLGKRITP